MDSDSSVSSPISAPVSPLSPRDRSASIEIPEGPPEIQPEELELGSKIGGGSFGSVYRGKCRGIDVAIKKLHKQTLPEKELAAFKKEVEILTRIRHVSHSVSRHFLRYL